MNRFAKNAVVALAFLMAVGTAWAAQPVSETYPVGQGAEVDIDVLSGTVTIVAGSDGVVEVTGTLGDGVESLEIDGDEGLEGNGAVDGDGDRLSARRLARDEGRGGEGNAGRGDADGG